MAFRGSAVRFSGVSRKAFMPVGLLGQSFRAGNRPSQDGPARLNGLPATGFSHPAAATRFFADPPEQWLKPREKAR